MRALARGTVQEHKVRHLPANRKETGRLPASKSLAGLATHSIQNLQMEESILEGFPAYIGRHPEQARLQQLPENLPAAIFHLCCRTSSIGNQVTGLLPSILIGEIYESTVKLNVSSILSISFLMECASSSDLQRAKTDGPAPEILNPSAPFSKADSFISSKPGIRIERAGSTIWSVMDLDIKSKSSV